MEVIFADVGAHTLTVTGVDSYGATGTAQVTITVVQAPDQAVPVVRIISPDVSSGYLPLAGTHELAGTATGFQGVQRDVEWSLEWSYVRDDGTVLDGFGPEIIGTALTTRWTPAASDSVTFRLQRTLF